MTNYIVKRYETPIPISTLTLNIDQNVTIVRYDQSIDKTNKTDISKIIRLVITKRIIRYIDTQAPDMKHVKLCYDKYFDILVNDKDTNSMALDEKIVMCEFESVKRLIFYCWNDILNPLTFYQDNSEEYVRINKIIPGYTLTKYSLLCSISCNNYKRISSFSIIRFLELDYAVCKVHDGHIHEHEDIAQNIIKEWLNTSDLSHKLLYTMFTLSELLEKEYLIKDILKIIIDVIISVI